MVQHTPTIRWQIADELFEYVWPFCQISAYNVKKLQDVMYEDIQNGVYIIIDYRTMEDLKWI